MLTITNGTSLIINFQSTRDCSIFLNLLNAANRQATEEILKANKNLRDCFYTLDNWGDVKMDGFYISEKIEILESRLKQNKAINLITNNLISKFYDIDCQFNK